MAEAPPSVVAEYMVRNACKQAPHDGCREPDSVHLVCLEVRQREDRAARHVLRKSHLRGHRGDRKTSDCRLQLPKLLQLSVTSEEGQPCCKGSVASQERTGASKTATEKCFCRCGCDDSAARSVVVPCECPAFTVLHAQRLPGLKTRFRRPSNHHKNQHCKHLPAAESVIPM